VIEHNLDVIKTSDWIVDMGPEGGASGGTVVAEGTPEDVAANPDSYTGHFLAETLDVPRPKPKKRNGRNGRKVSA
jgi:excinuclease ABC subunit A